MEKERYFNPKTGKEYFLDEYEQDIVDNFDKHIELDPEEKQKIMVELVEAAKNYNNASSNIRVPNPYLSKLKNKASELGIPYRTYILETLRKAC